MIRADFLIDHADVAATCAGPAPRTGRRQRDISPISDAAIAAFHGTIVYAGPSAGLREQVVLDDEAIRIDARGCAVVPGFVDPHTHLVYAGDRTDELRQRLSGATYAEIARRGGGIMKTVAATRAASEEELFTGARHRLDEMLACGTTTCEAKSGYGLTTESELRQLRVIQQLDAAHAIDVVPTFLGGHALPPEFRDNRAGYVALVIDDMIPQVAAGQLAAWCDVFCEDGAFTPEESLAMLGAGRRAGLQPRVHAEELGATGGVDVAVRAGARSADHLIFVNGAGADALAVAGVTAVLLPAAAFYLKLGRFAPARMLIDRAVPVALASDVNPGGGFSPSMPFVMTIACFSMDMTVEEALVAATLNAAWSIDRAGVAGSLEPGKAMDAVIVKGPIENLIRIGTSSVQTVVKRGRIAFSQ